MGMLTLLAVPQRREQPACLRPEFLLGPPPGIGEVSIRIAHHPLGTVIVVLDGDVDRHLGSLPHDLSVSRRPGWVNGPMVTHRPGDCPAGPSLRQRVREEPGEQPDQRHVRPRDPAFV